ncbi:MAG TPA: hypothetical protein PLE54_11960 [Burkholderiaceae bacterium]|nr:hypothetical protein [Burkholderiaceae bacterium]
MNPFLKFALFVVVGPLLIGLLYFSLMTRVTTHATQGMADGMERQSAAIAERARIQKAVPARQAADARRAQLEATAARLRAETAAASAEQQAAARKDAAWQAFFEPKKVCDNPPDSDTQVECGNAYMRAKREFEDRWARGEIQ